MEIKIPKIGNEKKRKWKWFPPIYEITLPLFMSMNYDCETIICFPLLLPV